MISDADIIVEMQHRHRELMHEIKGVYALLRNNVDLDEARGWSPEKAQEQHKHVMRLACDKLKRIFDPS